jgi:hypothetical protein
MFICPAVWLALVADVPAPARPRSPKLIVTIGLSRCTGGVRPRQLRRGDGRTPVGIVRTAGVFYDPFGVRSAATSWWRWRSPSSPCLLGAVQFTAIGLQMAVVEAA